MLKHLTDAFDNPKKEFTFSVGGRQVCEMGYLRILGMLCCKIVRNAHSSWIQFLGLITSKSKNKPEQWSASKNQLLGIGNAKENTPEVKEQHKFNHAVVFIRYLADVFAETGYEDPCSIDMANRPDVTLIDGFNDNKKQQI